MIALVEGAARQRTPNEIALSLVLSAFTLIFLIVTATLWPMARHAEQYMAGYLGADGLQEPRHRRPDAGGAARLPDPDDDRRAAGGHRHRRHGPGAAGEPHRQERQGGRGRRRRGHAAARQDRHDHDRQPPGDASSSRSATLAAAEVGPPRRPGVAPPTRRPRARASSSCTAGMPGSDRGAVPPPGSRFVAFTAQTRMSGVDLPDGRTHPQGRGRRRREARPGAGRHAPAAAARSR